MDRTTLDLLEHKAYQLRVDSIRATTAAGSGHPTSCLSAADLVSVLFFYAMQYNPQNPKQVNNDRFILSKGHAAPLLYAAFKQLGVISDEQLLTLRQFDSILEGHPTFRFMYAQVATGSLGCGLSIGLGAALANRLNEQTVNTYVLLGDSECAEGSIWEAAQVAAYYKANKLIAFIDVNRLGQTTQTIDGHSTQNYAAKFKAFGWDAIEVDGHDIKKIVTAVDKAKQSTEKPTVIIAKTFKGYGIKEAQDQLDFHGKAFSQEQTNKILIELELQFSKAAQYDGKPFELNLPEFNDEQITCSDFTLPIPDFHEKIATRQAYGQAIALAGSVCDGVICLDAEVKNSTFAELFEEQHPYKFFQCFIAEQNMVGMGVGFTTGKKIPFISTFAAFFTRAFDQIRMAAIGKNPIRLAGSHVGVSIGQDGPSQMGLEDIAMMRTIPGSVVLYPCDAVSTFKLVQLMANYHDGVSYIRLTRQATDSVYTQKNSFEIGGCAVLRQPTNAKALIIAAGITVHEALKAADQLEKEGISVSVIDLYCIKPLNAQVVIEVAKQSHNRIITVEDHYLEGGLGQAVAAAVVNSGFTVTNLAVTELPRSGKPEELLAWAGIDADAIMKVVKTGN
jgi:transketolase